MIAAVDVFDEVANLSLLDDDNGGYWTVEIDVPACGFSHGVIRQDRFRKNVLMVEFEGLTDEDRLANVLLTGDPNGLRRFKCDITAEQARQLEGADGISCHITDDGRLLIDFPK